jgi:hypothetical protein
MLHYTQGVSLISFRFSKLEFHRLEEIDSKGRTLSLKFNELVFERLF